MNSQPSVTKAHYSRPEVREEIARFSKDRWVGIHCSSKARDGRPLLLRYDHNRPLTVRDADQVEQLFRRFRGLKPRTIYATANTYSKLLNRSDVSSLRNVVACMPTWDIDNEVEGWKLTIRAAREIREFLETRGIRSTVIKWSGKGVHVHIHQNAISEELRKKVHPLRAAYAIVEYTNRKLAHKFEQMRSEMGSRTLRVDNEMDQQRLFTAPLSLHRELDMVAVVLDPDKLESFDLSFVKAGTFRHFGNWEEFQSGEADDLAQEALESVRF